VAEPAQAIGYEDLLLMKVLGMWTFDCEAARNSGPDTLGEKFVIEAKHLLGQFSQQDLVREEGCGCGCTTERLIEFVNMLFRF